MDGQQWIPGLLAAAMLGMTSGCMVPRSQLESAQSQNRVLREQTKAQLAEIENLRAHARQAENQLSQTEQRMASLQDQVGLNQRQLTNYERERDELHQQVKGLANAHLTVSPEMGRRLETLCQKFPTLKLDPHGGVAKLDTDILFDSGRTELKNGAAQVLSDLVQALKGPDGQDLRVLVVGHTDDRAIARRPVRDQYPSNFDLSTARAQTVADQLRKLGLDDHRLGVAGFAASQPVTPNVTQHDRQKNRRVEVFVMAPEVPVVGWTDSMPGLY